VLLFFGPDPGAEHAASQLMAAMFMVMLVASYIVNRWGADPELVKRDPYMCTYRAVKD
jgi:hypothetical protein